MKSVTYEEFLKFEPCWLRDEEQAKWLEDIGKRKARWTAIDVLNLPEEEVSAVDKLWAVLRPEFIEENILHEFACRCAEEALKLVENPDPRSIAAIEAKRKWVRGEISDKELMDAARDAASDAASDAAWDAASDAARYAAWAAASDAASDAARAAAWAAARAAASAAASAAAWAAAWAAARKRQVEILKELLDENLDRRFK